MSSVINEYLNYYTVLEAISGRFSLLVPEILSVLQLFSDVFQCNKLTLVQRKFSEIKFSSGCFTTNKSLKY